jgi:hypothetical protein
VFVLLIFPAKISRQKVNACSGYFFEVSKRKFSKFLEAVIAIVKGVTFLATHLGTVYRSLFLHFNIVKIRLGGTLFLCKPFLFEMIQKKSALSCLVLLKSHVRSRPQS